MCDGAVVSEAASISLSARLPLGPPAPVASPASLEKKSPPKRLGACNEKDPKMPPYDSESSDDGDDYTETNVLLGYATKDATADAVSHIGGAPVRVRS